MNRRFIAATTLLALAACSKTRATAEKDPAPPATTTTASPVVSGSASAAAALPHVDASIAAPPRSDSAFGVLAEGPCPELDVDVVENAAFVRYGHYYFPPGESAGVKPEIATIARVASDGAVQIDPALMAGLPTAASAEGLAMVFYPVDVVSIRGTWPDKLTLTLFGEGGERVGSRTITYFWGKSHRWNDPSEDLTWMGDDQEWPWLNGSTLVRTRLLGDDVRAARAAFETAGKDGGIHNGNELSKLAGDPHFAIIPAHATYAPSFDALKGCKDFVSAEADILVRPGQLWMAVYCDHGPMTGRGYSAPADPAILHWDKSTASRLKIPANVGFDSQQGRLLEVEEDGTLWARFRQGLYRRSPDGTWTEDLAKAMSVAWKNHKPAWAVVQGKRDVYRRTEDGRWETSELPRPAFSATATLTAGRVMASDAGDTWVVASYLEKGPAGGRGEGRTALLRLGASHAPMRCDGGFADWPPPATEGCATPVALLARLSKSAPKNYDFPQTRSALKGHTELEGTQFIEIDLARQRFLAAKVKSLDAGHALVDLVASGVKGTRPELVCTEPKVTRTLTIDLATGTLQL